MNKIKRRTFLRTIGGAAGAAAIGGSTTRSVEQSTNAPVSTSPITAKRNRPQKCSYSVGDVVPHKAPFAQDYRKPGWLPDALDPGDPQKPRYFMFPDEALKYWGSDAFPFRLPRPVDPDPSWILGGPIPDQPAKSGHKPFVRLIRKFARAIRAYNATLYDLRRYHFKKYDIDLPSNKYGNKDHQGDLPDPNDGNKFDPKAHDAEEKWKAAAQDLTDLIDPDNPPNQTFGLEIVAADMVQVNNYIVSMRLVVTPSGPEKYREIGGSDSSHVSISSAFSSPSP